MSKACPAIFGWIRLKLRAAPNGASCPGDASADSGDSRKPTFTIGGKNVSRAEPARNSPRSNRCSKTRLIRRPNRSSRSPTSCRSHSHLRHHVGRRVGGRHGVVVGWRQDGRSGASSRRSLADGARQRRRPASPSSAARRHSGSTAARTCSNQPASSVRTSARRDDRHFLSALFGRRRVAPVGAGSVEPPDGGSRVVIRVAIG